MKPLGTITSYLPFMDSETSQAVLEEMEAAVDYGDFVKRLCDRVCIEEASQLTVYFATHYAFMISAYDCLARISERYGNLPTVRPALFFASAAQGGKGDFAKAREAAGVVLAAGPPDWLALEMYLIQLDSVIFDYPARLLMDKTVENIERIMSSNPSLSYFRVRLYYALSEIERADGTLEQAATLNTQAQMLATEYDDQVLLAEILRMRARSFEYPDRKSPRELLRISGNILKFLGVTSELANVIAELSVLEASCGSYSAAIEYELEAFRISELLGLPTGILAHNISALYNAAENGEAGLAWSEMAEQELDGYPSFLPGCRLNQAWSLVLQGELEKATDIIDSTRESVFKSGLESDLAWLYFAEGVLELAQGDCSDASTSLERALETDERCSPGVRVNMCLYQLAKAEVAAASESDGFNSDDNGGYWLARLEECGRTDDMPGILGQALLLKAELCLAQSNLQEAKSVLIEVSSLAAEPSLEFLRRGLDRLLEHVDGL